MNGRRTRYRSSVSTSRAASRLLALCLASLVGGCSGSPRVQEPTRTREPAVVEAPEAPGGLDEEDAPPTVYVHEEDAAPEGPRCSSSGECDGGLACRGPRGCGVEWACGAPLDCTGERVAYCDCDGSTFYAPIGCPGRPYAQPGSCDTMGPLAGADELGVHAYDEPPTTEDRECSSQADCSAGRQCYGPPGCGVTWRCERLSGCRGTSVELCGCDGQTFRAVPSCAGRPYLHVGPCDGEIAIASASGESARRRGASDAIAATRPAAPERPTASDAVSSTERLCASSRDCRRGEVCEGPEGCGMTWTCRRPAARCNPDTQVFCDCDMNTFRASMNCPGRPYAHRGSCDIDRMLQLSGAAVR